MSFKFYSWIFVGNVAKQVVALLAEKNVFKIDAGPLFENPGCSHFISIVHCQFQVNK